MKQERNLMLDGMKIILAIMVIGIHSHLFFDVNKFMYSITSNGIFRIAVPIFLLINGYFFYSINTKSLLKKWSSRVLTLYVFWMLVFSPFWLSISNDFTSSILGAIKTIIFGYHHLWYLSAMLLAGLIVFLLKNKVKTMIFLSCLLYLFGCLLQYFADYNVTFFDIKFSELPLIVRRNFLFVAIPFFYCGYLLNKFKKSINSITALVITLSLFLLEVVIRYISTDTEIGFDIQIMSIPLSVCLFLYVLGLNKKTNDRLWSDISSSIYFIHPLFVSIVIYSGVKSTILLFLIVTLLAIISSFFLCFSDKYKKII